MKIRRNQQGFTIVELMIATSAFSILLIVCLGALIYMGRLYYKGATQARTQEVAREAVDSFSEAAQFSGFDLATLPGDSTWSGAYCIGVKKYSYKLRTQLELDSPGANQSDQVLIVSEDPNCQASGTPAPANNQRELLDEFMRLSEFDVNQVAGLVNVDLTIAFGGNASITTDANGNSIPDDDEAVFNIDSGGAITSCKESNVGSEFCAVSNLSTTVYRKVN